MVLLGLGALNRVGVSDYLTPEGPYGVVHEWVRVHSWDSIVDAPAKNLQNDVSFNGSLSMAYMTVS